MTRTLAIIAVTKRDGRLCVLDRETYAEHVHAMGEGEEQEMTIGPVDVSRTARQNRYLHAEPIKKFCAKTGYTPAEMKLVLLGTHFGWKTLPTGEAIPEEPSTADLSKEQMTGFIEWLIQFGAEQGLNILPPEPDPAKRDPRVTVEESA